MSLALSIRKKPKIPSFYAAFSLSLQAVSYRNLTLFHGILSVRDFRKLRLQDGTAFYRRTAKQHEQGKYHSTDEDDAKASAGTGKPDPDPYGKTKELEFLNAMLSDRLTLAQRKRFGASSEKYADGYTQLNLFNEAEQEADLDGPEPDMEEIHPSSYKRKKRSGKRRRIFPLLKRRK